MVVNLNSKFWSQIQVTPYCWIWIGGKKDNGRGRVRISDRLFYAYHLTWEYYNGPRDEGVRLDHRCRNRSCVNPQHMRPVTDKQNMENLGLASNNKSGYRGVSWDKRRSKWRASVGHNGKQTTIGHFDGVEEAAEAARLKRLELFTHNEEDQRLTR